MAPGDLTATTGRNRFYWPWWGLSFVLALLYFFRLGAPGLMDPDEGRYAEIAREMLLTGNYWLPQLNFLPYLEKPPLVYWLTALSLHLGGGNEGAARLTPALSALLGIGGVYWWGRRLFDAPTALLAAVITATSWGFFLLGRLLTLDMTLTCCLIWGLGLAYEAWERQNRRFLWLSYGVLGLGVLTKGPVALVLPGLIFFLWLWGQQRLGEWRFFWEGRGLLLLLLLNLPWYLTISWRQPGFLSFFLGHEHLARFWAAPVHGGRPLYYYLILLPLFLLPWTWWLPLGLARLPAAVGPAGSASPQGFLLLGAGAIVVFFSLASAKLPPYILPAVPLLALWLAAALRPRWPREGGGRPPGWRLSLGLWLLTGLTLVLVFSVIRLGRPATWQHLAQLSPWVELLLVGLVLWPLLLFPLWRRPRLALALAVVSALSFSLILSGGLERLARFRSPRELARTLQDLRRPGAVLVGYQAYSQALSFYTGLPFYLYGLRGELDQGLRLRPDTPFWLKGPKDLRQLSHRGQVFILLPREQTQALAAAVGVSGRPVAQWKKFILVLLDEQL